MSDLINRKELITRLVSELEIYESDGMLYYDARQVDRIVNTMPAASIGEKTSVRDSN